MGEEKNENLSYIIPPFFHSKKLFGGDKMDIFKKKPSLLLIAIGIFTVILIFGSVTLLFDAPKWLTNLITWIAGILFCLSLILFCLGILDVINKIMKKNDRNDEFNFSSEVIANPSGIFILFATYFGAISAFLGVMLYTSGNFPNTISSIITDNQEYIIKLVKQVLNKP